MSVRLICSSKPVIADLKTGEDLIAYAARVSNPSNQLNNATAGKLLAYCVKNQHWSIFETVSLTVEINTTRDIGRQILRHRSFSFQEFSQRYAEVVDDKLEYREARIQDSKNRQNSIELNNVFDNESRIISEWQFLQEQVYDNAKLNYRAALEMGIAKEQARALLPEGLTPTKMYMAGTLRSWLHYIALRTGNGTQKEHRLIARECAEILKQEYPSLVEVINGMVGESH